MVDLEIIKSPVDYTTLGVQEKREIARSKLALALLHAASGTVVLGLITGSLLLYFLPDKVEFRDVITLVLALGSIFSGLLGSAVAWYFSNN